MGVAVATGTIIALAGRGEVPAKSRSADPFAPIFFGLALLFPQQLRQLRHVDRDPTRLILRQQLGRCSPSAGEPLSSTIRGVWPTSDRLRP
jgi:hypothetical protein